ncbi:MAG: zinc-ribbon domain-containing protein [Candidatus Anammoxibacter sp.]
MNDYFVCPNCGVELPLKAIVCSECGSDENTGWSDETMYDGLDLPDIDDSAESSMSIFQNRYVLYIVVSFTILAFVLFYLM